MPETRNAALRKVHAALRRLAGESGQGMTEYIIIVALVGIAAIGVTTIFGQNIRLTMGVATAALAGETNVSSPARSGMREASKTKGLKDFGVNAGR